MEEAVVGVAVVVVAAVRRRRHTRRRPRRRPRTSLSSSHRRRRRRRCSITISRRRSTTTPSARPPSRTPCQPARTPCPGRHSPDSSNNIFIYCVIAAVRVTRRCPHITITYIIMHLAVALSRLPRVHHPHYTLRVRWVRVGAWEIAPPTICIFFTDNCLK